MKKLAKYEMIYQDLKERILNGAFSNGKLPSISELTNDYDASLLTINNAVKKLAAEGFVSRSSGRSGTRIRQPGLYQLNKNDPHLNSWNDCLAFPGAKRVELRYLSDRRGLFLPDEMNSLIKEFERRYPWIHVTQDYTVDIDVLKTSDHDLIQGSHASLLPLIEQGKLMDLKPFFQTFGRCNSILHDEHTAPLMITLPLLFFRRNEVTEPPAGWEALLEFNRKLKAEGKYSSSLLGFSSFLFFFIGNIRHNLMKPEKESHLRLAIQMLYEYYNWETPWNNLSPKSISLALKDKKISVFMGYFSGTFMDSDKNFDYELLPYPDQYMIETIRIGINANTRHIMEAWLFLNFLRSEYVQKKVVSTKFGIPYRESVFHDDFRKAYPKLYDLMIPLLDKLEENYISEELRIKIYHVIYPLLEQFFAREFTMDECVRSLRDAMNELLLLDRIQYGSERRSESVPS